MSWLVRRVLPAVAVFLAAWPVLAGCTVPANGLTGVAVGGDGHLVVVLAWSGRQPDAVQIYHRESGVLGERSVDDASVRVPPVAGAFAEVRVGARVEGRLQPDVLYTAYGTTDDDSSSTRAVEFRLSSVRRLRPGLVLFQDMETSSGAWVDVVVRQDEFRRRAAGCCG